MPEIRSESRLLWTLLIFILTLPITIILIIFRKRKLDNLLDPLREIRSFIFEARLTITIILLTITVSAISWFYLPDDTSRLLVSYPKDLTDYTRWYAIITSAFIHSGFSHLFGNILGIFIFGRVVERKLGTKKTAMIYFGAMLISNIGDSGIALLSGDTAGRLGASGALMGLVAAAMLIDPTYITYELLVPLPIMVVAWLAIASDLLGILGYSSSSTTAHIAHLFGYLSIAILIYLLSTEERQDMKQGLKINIISIPIALAAYIAYRSYFP